MDAFLRRVIEQRELEQEVAILATPAAVVDPPCRVCGGRVQRQDRGYVVALSRVAVCTTCGGQKTARRIEAEDAERDARARRTAALLSLVGINPNQEHAMTNPRKCTKCSKILPGRTIGEICKGCREGAPEIGGGQDSSPRRSKSKPDVLKRFKVVARALGVDPDALIAEFCEGWIERVRSSANFGNSSSS